MDPTAEFVLKLDKTLGNEMIKQINELLDSLLNIVINKSKFILKSEFEVLRIENDECFWLLNLNWWCWNFDTYYMFRVSFNNIKLKNAGYIPIKLYDSTLRAKFMFHKYHLSIVDKYISSKNFLRELEIKVLELI